MFEPHLIATRIMNSFFQEIYFLYAKKPPINSNINAKPIIPRRITQPSIHLIVSIIRFSGNFSFDLFLRALSIKLIKNYHDF